MKTLLEYIYEHAFKKEAFYDRLFDRAEQIAQNTALVCWVRRYDPHNINMNHWKKELYAAAKIPTSDKIKKGKSKRSTIDSVCDDLNLFTITGISDLIDDKFKSEGIYDKSKILIIYEDTINELFKLMELIDKSSLIELDKYIKSM